LSGIVTAMSTRDDHNIWPGISCTDAHAARAWLAGIGFDEGILVPGEKPDEIMHSEMIWPEGGRVMVHSQCAGDLAGGPGTCSCYIVTADPDAAYEKARAAGARIVRELEDTDYGSRGFTVSDPEGNTFSFGTYAGAEG
jgi:uncharacterized glyoxalase superfamily protein PhnB